MSELQPLAAGNALTPEGDPEPAGTGGMARESFWARAGRAYWRGAMARLATLWVLAIVILAVIVPFVANGAPFTAVVDGKRSFPLFRNLTGVDWIVFTIAAAGLVFMWWWRRLGKQAIGGDALSVRRWQLFFLVTGATTAACVGIAIFKSDNLDKRDYRDLARTGQITSVIFPPVRWGYADQEPLELNRLFEYPSKDHLLGTDGNGRDALARLLWGSRIVLGIGLVSEVIALAIGVVYGALMGYFVGKTDILGMRFVEVVEAIPTLFLLITFIALYGRNLFMIMVIIGLTGWTGIARFVRAEFLRIRQLEYVAAAQALGLPLRNILFKHMLPNGLTPVIVTFSFGVAANVVSESILSFLGIGVEPPTPSWGSMLNEAGNPAETFRWWLAIAPGLLIFLTVFAYNLMGEALRDAIDPRTNEVE